MTEGDEENLLSCDDDELCPPIQYRRRQDRFSFSRSAIQQQQLHVRNRTLERNRSNCVVSQLFSFFFFIFFPIVFSQQSIGILFRNRVISMADGAVQAATAKFLGKMLRPLTRRRRRRYEPTRGRLCAFSIIIKRRRLSHDDCRYLTAKSFVRLPPSLHNLLRVWKKKKKKNFLFLRTRNPIIPSTATTTTTTTPSCRG